MSTTLTDNAIRKARREALDTGLRRDLADAFLPGLRLRVTPKGTATWVLACRDRAGRMRRFPLGQYPECGISQARNEARSLHARVKQDGADPVADRRRERAKAADAKLGVGTLAALLDHYGDRRGNTQKTWADARKRINLVFKPLLARATESLTAADFQLLADRHGSVSSASFAVRSLRPALRWAAAPGRGHVPDELARIRPPAPVRRRRRVLTRDELAALLPILQTSGRPYAAALHFMLLTLLRRQEAASARWRDVDWQANTLTIPVTKTGEPHVVPLSHQALDLLHARRPEIPARDGLIFAASTGGPLAAWDRETKRLQQASRTSGWTRHDLRRTGATMLGEMGELPDIVEAALNHASIRSPLAATYNRSRYRPQVAAALQRLADALDGIEAGAAKVVQLRGDV